jgi:hypothetical protein
MEITPEQRALFEAIFTNLETGIALLNTVIERFDQKRAEFIVQRDAALQLLADTRARLGIETVLQ